MSVLERFKTLPTAHEVARPDTLSAAVAGFARDTITLGWEDRLRTRGRRRTDSGIEFGTALPRGTVLHSDDCLVVTALQLVVSVVELAERVLVIRPPAPEAWALYAYHIGNGHQPLMLTSGALVCPDVLGARQILDQHGIAFTVEVRAFTPVGTTADHRH